MARSPVFLASAALVAASLCPAAAAAPPSGSKAAAADCDAAGGAAKKDKDRAPAACHAINSKGTGATGRAAQAAAADAAACPAPAGERVGPVTGTMPGGPVIVTASRGVVTAAGQMTGDAKADEPAAHAKDTPPRVTGVSQGGPVTVTATYRETAQTGAAAPAPANIAITEEGGNNQHADRPRKPAGVAQTAAGGSSSTASGKETPPPRTFHDCAKSIIGNIR